MPTDLGQVVGTSAYNPELTPKQRVAALGAILRQCAHKLKEMPRARPIADLVAEGDTVSLPDGRFTLKTRLFDFYRISVKEGRDHRSHVLCLSTDGVWGRWTRSHLVNGKKLHEFAPMAKDELEFVLRDETVLYVVIRDLLKAVQEGEKRTRKSNREYVIAEYELASIQSQLGYGD